MARFDDLFCTVWHVFDFSFFLCYCTSISTMAQVLCFLAGLLTLSFGRKLFLVVFVQTPDDSTCNSLFTRILMSPFILLIAVTHLVCMLISVCGCSSRFSFLACICPSLFSSLARVGTTCCDMECGSFALEAAAVCIVASC